MDTITVQLARRALQTLGLHNDTHEDQEQAL
jgi:hypothetical protein